MVSLVNLLSVLFPIFQGYSPPGVRKCGVFLHEPQQTTDLKFVYQLKIKSSDHMTLFDVTWSTCLQSFFVARAESYFPPRDWLKTK